MPAVTIAGANAQTVTLSFDTNANAALAQRLAAAITAGVQAGNILAASDTDGPPPTLPDGTTGAFFQSQDGTTILPPGFKAVVDTASDAIIFGSGDAGESVLIGTGAATFIATGGSGTVVGGGGNDRIVIPADDGGNWSINTGNGDDTVMALGGGNDTIGAGGGHNAIDLGSGNDLVQSTGDDTVNASVGRATIAATGTHGDLIFGNSSQLLFVANSGSATVFGGSGSDTFFGGSGPDLVHGGTGGNNFLNAGTGTATLFGGGKGDVLNAFGAESQILQAGVGSETLFGGFASGANTFIAGLGADQMTGGTGNDTFVGGSGSATITGATGDNLFSFTNGQAGGHDVITDFTSGSDAISLSGYGKNEVAHALGSQVVAGTSTTITLTDSTKITFSNVTTLHSSDFS